MARRHRVMDNMTRPSRRIYTKRQTRRIPVLALIVLPTLFILVAVVLVVRFGEYRTAREEYVAYQTMDSDAGLLVSATELKPPSPSFVTIEPFSMATPTDRPFHSSKVGLLREENSDAVGWLDITGTEMQYPVVQTSDNDYYMTHTFKKKRNASGAIFLDCWNAPDFTDFNTVIYGHNMKDGSMFGDLREYRHQKFFDEHSYIVVTLLNKKLRYRVFAAYISKGEASADFRGQTCATELERSAFIKAARKRSTDIASSLPVSRDDRLLTLVTCTSGAHPWFWVVHAVLEGEEM